MMKRVFLLLGPNRNQVIFPGQPIHRIQEKVFIYHHPNKLIINEVRIPETDNRTSIPSLVTIPTRYLDYNSNRDGPFAVNALSNRVYPQQRFGLYRV